MDSIDEELVETLRAIVGEDTPDTTLRALLLRAGGDVAGAANSFFDGGVSTLHSSSAQSHSAAPQMAVGDDVLGTLFKTLEDQGRKLAERDQQLDAATRVCEALARRLRETERSLATADADMAERSERLEAEVQTEAEPAAAADDEAPPTTTLLDSYHSFAATLLRFAATRLLPESVLRALGGVPYLSPMLQRLTYGAVGGGGGLGGGDGQPARVHETAADEPDDADDAEEEEPMDVVHDGDEDEDEEASEEEGDEEEEDDDDEDDDEEEAGAMAEAEAALRAEEASRAAELAATVASTQQALLEALDLPSELLEQVAAWERQQAEAETEWRLRESRMHLEFEERKRRLHEQQLGQRKKLRESCDAALQPTYAEGTNVCAALSELLVGKICRLCEHAPGSSVPQAMLPGALARISGVSFGHLDSPLRVPNCPSRSVGSVPVSTGILVSLRKICDRNGIAMLPASDDPLASFSRGGRGRTELKVPLRLLSSRVRMLTDAETQSAAENADDRVFVVRYAGSDGGGPIEPVQILPEGLSLADYDISFAAGAAALRVEHRLDGPVKCRAEPAAAKQVFADTPVELYTQEVDPETHNIVQVYFSDLRDEVAVDVLNLTGTTTTLEDAECCAFPPDATGAALNYKIIVRDGAVLAVLYQEGDDVHASPFVEHRLPPTGAFVTLPDGALGRLGALPRGLIVAREPQDLPENAPTWPAHPGLRHKGKHPAELPGMVDLQVLQRDGEVLWPPHECSVPVCALTTADSGRLRAWHAQWDAYVAERAAAAQSLASHIEELLAAGKLADGTTAKEMVSELTESYGRLEELQREIGELAGDGELAAQGVDDERLTRLQSGIRRFAACARFG